MKSVRYRFRSVLAVLFAAVLCSATAAAQELTFKLDPASSRVEFSLSDFLHTVHGRFLFTRGTLRFDPATGVAGGELIADATSGNSGNSLRDGIMHRDVLESKKYPEIIFTPQHVDGKFAADGTSKVEIKGIMTLHGQQHPMTIPVALNVAQDRAVADAHFTIPYVRWGLKDPSVLFLRVTKTTDVTVHVEGRLTATRPPVAGPAAPAAASIPPPQITSTALPAAPPPAAP